MTEIECMQRIEFANERSPIYSVFVLAKQCGISGEQLLALIEKRLWDAKERLGPLEEAPPRDWLQEAAEEMADTCVYLAHKEDDERGMTPGRL